MTTLPRLHGALRSARPRSAAPSNADSLPLADDVTGLLPAPSALKPAVRSAGE